MPLVIPSGICRHPDAATFFVFIIRKLHFLSFLNRCRERFCGFIRVLSEAAFGLSDLLCCLFSRLLWSLLFPSFYLFCAKLAFLFVVS